MNYLCETVVGRFQLKSLALLSILTIICLEFLPNSQLIDVNEENDILACWELSALKNIKNVIQQIFPGFLLIHA